LRNNKIINIIELLKLISMNIYTKVLSALIAVILLNSASGGFILMQAGEKAGIHNQELKTLLKCGVGLILVSPLNEYTILGREIVLFSPSFKDILITFVIFMFVLYFLSMRYGEISWPEMSALFFGIWFLLKIIGIALVLSSGSECITLVSNANRITSPLAQISIVVIPVMVAKVVARKIGFG